MKQKKQIKEDLQNKWNKWKYKDNNKRNRE